MPERLVTEPTTTRQHIGRCPGCGSGIYAEVQLVTVVHPPRLIDGKPQDCAHAVVVASRVEHRCEREVDGEWTYPSEDWTDRPHITNRADDQGESCDHDWLDRPESDTRECWICGEERNG